MRFSTSIALVAAAIAPVALAQSVTIDSVTLTQCATSTLSFEGSTGPYYVAVLPGSDPCTEDALAEYFDVTGNSVQYLTNLASGTTVQIYVLDVNGNETWGQIETVGDGDGSCLPGASTTISSDSATSTSSSSSSSSAAPSSYIPPNAATSQTYSSPSDTGDSYDNTDNTDNSNTSDNTNDTPANAADDTTGGASTVTASASLLLGAFIAAAALL